MINYKLLSEKLINDWKSNALKIEGDFGFNLDALPEPYLSFGANSDGINFLTTNPGGVMDFQRKEYSFIEENETYKKLSARLAQFYEENLNGPSRTRIKNMYEIANKLNFESFTQFEISPFHSTSFPEKEKFSKYCIENKNNIHSEYLEKLKDHLENLNCICIQSGYPNLNRLNKNWFKLLSKLLSVETKNWQTLYFKMKNEKATTGAFYHKNNKSYKVILFNSAGNYCPKIDTMNELFNIIHN